MLPHATGIMGITNTIPLYKNEILILLFILSIIVFCVFIKNINR